MPFPSQLVGHNDRLCLRSGSRALVLGANLVSRTTNWAGGWPGLAHPLITKPHFSFQLCSQPWHHSLGCPVQAWLGRGFLSARTLTVGNIPGPGQISLLSNTPTQAELGYDTPKGDGATPSPPQANQYPIESTLLNCTA